MLSAYVVIVKALGFFLGKREDLASSFCKLFKFVCHLVSPAILMRPVQTVCHTLALIKTGELVKSRAFTI